jgi:hypothetical protein
MTCGAPEQGGSVAGTEVGGQTVIQGQVVRDAAPVAAAYVRLLDSGGEFTAEVVTSANGDFRFFAAPGEWTLRALATGATGERALTAAAGINTVRLELAGQLARPARSPEG